MDIEKIKINTSSSAEIILPSSGAMGLQLLYRCDNNSIVEIRRIETDKDGSHKTPPMNIGSDIPVTFVLKGLKPGEARVSFYKTQPWNKDFKEIIAKEIIVTVE